jgi:PAS domain S-box-containing protein
VTDPGLAQRVVDNARAYAIFTLDFNGVITSWGPGAQAVLGYEAEEAIGQPFTILFLAPDQAAQSDRIELEKAISTGTAEDTRWHLRKNGERFWANGMTMRMQDAPGLVKIMRDETRSKLAEDQRVLLLNELNHRIKNTFATVQSIVDQTLRSHGVGMEIRRSLTDRLMALAQAHDALLHESWASADLKAIVATVITPHDPRRFTVDGPVVQLSPGQAVSMSLVLHELTTNAIKYGALSATGGSVKLSWNNSYNEQGGRNLTLLWEETGGPPVAPPKRAGFGSRLISRSFENSGGRATSEFAPDGLRCLIEAPLSAAEELPDLEHRAPSRGPAA